MCRIRLFAVKNKWWSSRLCLTFKLSFQASPRIRRLARLKDPAVTREEARDETNRVDVSSNIILGCISHLFSSNHNILFVMSL